MRNAIVVAAFAASAFAAPHNHKHKRAEVIVTDVEYATVVDIVTVTADSPPPAATTTVAPASSSSSSKKHHWHWSSWNWSSAKTSTTAAPAPTTTSTYVAPAPSSYEAPSSSAEPETTEAPATTAAPSTTKAPATTAKPTTVWTTSAKPTSTKAAATSAAAAGSYSQVAVAHHNLHRSNHSAPAIEWDDDLASISQSIADTCVYAHNTTAGGGGYGQNIAAGVKPENISAVITELFYNGEVGWYDGLYGEENPDMTNFEKWGHFSQIVWKSTTHVGCATTDCSSSGLGNVGGNVAPFFTVCNYKGPGNFGGEYGDNIKAPKNDATAYWNTGSWVES